MLRTLGGDVATVILGQNATPEALSALRESLGLDRPWTTQYLDWVSGLFRGDLGTSYSARFDIFEQIQSRLTVTLALVMGAVLVSSVLAYLAGTYAALHVRDRRGSLIDVIAQIGLSVPTFLSGLLLIGFGAIRLGWFPAGGYVSWTVDPAASFRSLVLPVLALATPVTAVLTRYVRSAMLDVINEDYIRTAMSKGRTRSASLVIHGTRNASITLVTVITLQIGALLTGAVVIENVFTLPGLGSMLVTAVQGREAIVVQSVAFVVLLLILGLNFAMDLAYGVLDPRIRTAGVDRS